jgi:hypothetical protein
MRRYLTIIILFLSITGVAFSQVPPPFILPPAIPYPAGSGIPIVSGGMSWGTTLGVGTLGTAFKLAAYTATNTLGELAAVGGVGEVLIGNFGAIPSFSSSPLVATLTAASANSITVGADSASSGPAIGSVIFHNATNTNHFQILSGTTLAALSWTLPVNAPAGNNYLLNASTVGVLSYTDPATFQGVLTNSAGLLAALNDETGTGVAVFNNTPTLITPVLGAATGTTLSLSGTATLTLGTASSLSGQILLKSAGSADTVTIQPGTTSTSYTLTLPPSVAGGADYLIKSSAAGVLGYTDPATFSPVAGSSSMAQLASTITIGTAGNKVICAAGVCGVYLNDGVTLARWDMGLLVITGFDGTAATAGNIKPMSASTASGVVTLGALHF